MTGLFAKIGTMLKVDKQMIPAKVACFLAGCHVGSYTPYLNVFFISVGLSTFQSGVITGVMNVLPIIASPIWGYIVDRTGRRVLVLLALTTVGSSLISPLPWVAQSILPMGEFQGNSTIRTADSHRTNITSISSAVNISEVSTNMNTEPTGTLMRVLLGIILISSIFIAPLTIFIETLVMNVVKLSSSGATFGAQRVFWSVGVTIGNLLSGIVADHYKNPDLSQYTGFVFVFLPCTLLLFPIGCFLAWQINKHHLQSEVGNQEVNEIKKNNVDVRPTQVLRFLFRFDMLFFLLAVFMVGCAISLLVATSYIHVSDTMKKSKTEMTFVVTTRTISAVAVYPFTAEMIKILRGPVHTIQFGALVNFILFLIMSFDISFEAFVCVQLLFGFTNSLPWTACMEYCHDISPVSIRATTNAIVITTFRSVANLVANVGGLKIYQLNGGRRLYFGFSILYLSVLLVLVVYYDSRKLMDCFRRQTGETCKQETERIADCETMS